MGSGMQLAGLLVCLLSCTAAVAAQRPDSTATIVGRVSGPDERPLAEAAVLVGSLCAHTDSLGGYRIERVPPGTVRVSVRVIGYTRRDTTLTLHAMRTSRWDVQLAVSAYSLMSEGIARQNRSADSANTANGTTDSAASGLILSHGTGAPPYERFGARLLADLARRRGSDSNTVISPLSAGMALALVAGGASDATYAALTRVIEVGTLDATLLAQRDSLLLLALSHRSDVTLEVANALWLSLSYRVRPAYVAKASHAYVSRVSTVDLTTDAAVGVVNGWVAEKTHGKIPTILAGPLSDTTALVVTNAVYFHGLWLKAFDSAATRPLAFHIRPGAAVLVPGMERTAEIGYFRGAAMQAIRLPYRGGRAALYVILPDSGTRVEDAESLLASGGLPPLASAYSFRDVHLRLPRVHAEATMGLETSLMALGAAIAFDCGKADFRAMLILIAGQNACIGSITQKTYIDIDEKGTEAAVVTAIGMVTTTGVSVPPPPIEFIVDRPFLIVLRDEVSGVALFMGRIVDTGTSIVRR